MIDSRIGKRFKQYREALGLTQSEFAEKAGFTVNYISTIERGTAFPRCESLRIQGGNSRLLVSEMKARPVGKIL